MEKSIWVPWILSSYESQSCVMAYALGFIVVEDFEKSLSQPFNVGIGKN